MTIALGGLMADCSVLIRPKLSFKFQSSSIPLSPINSSRIIPPRPRLLYLLAKGYGPGPGPGPKYAAAAATSVGRNHHISSTFDYDDDDLPKHPFWFTWTNEAFLALKSLFAFLVEQPSQLKYIEWPSFQSTLKTASLTLVLVALLIVALSSVDSALCYMLALLLRRTP